MNFLRLGTNYENVLEFSCHSILLQRKDKFHIDKRQFAAFLRIFLNKDNTPEIFNPRFDPSSRSVSLLKMGETC